MITYSTQINDDNSITFKLLGVTGGVVEYEDGFLKIVPLGAGFSGRLGYGELVLMITEGSTGELTSPCYEAESDRIAIITRITQSMEVVNG